MKLLKNQRKMAKLTSVVPRKEQVPTVRITVAHGMDQVRRRLQHRCKIVEVQVQICMSQLVRKNFVLSFTFQMVCLTPSRKGDLGLCNCIPVDSGPQLMISFACPADLCHHRPSAASTAALMLVWILSIRTVGGCLQRQWTCR